MFVRVKFVNVILFLMSLSCNTVLALNSTHTKINCCDVWTAVSAFTVEKTGSTMSFDTCVESNQCMQNKLIKQFLAQSQRLLKQKVEFNDNAELVVSSKQWSEDIVTQLLVWAFVGRVVSGHEYDENALKIVYDFQTDKLSLKRSVCEFDHNIHTCMVLISVSLLTYFIVDRVVSEHSSAMKQQMVMSTCKQSTSSQAFSLNTPYSYAPLRNKTSNLI